MTSPSELMSASCLIYLEKESFQIQHIRVKRLVVAQVSWIDLMLWMHCQFSWASDKCQVVVYANGSQIDQDVMVRDKHPLGRSATARIKSGKISSGGDSGV